jgi:hypothetical protein
MNHHPSYISKKIAVTISGRCKMKKVNLIYTDSVVIQNLADIEEYGYGKLEGFVLAVKTKEGYTITAHDGDLSYIEKLGLAQSIINDLNVKANRED